MLLLCSDCKVDNKRASNKISNSFDENDGQNSVVLLKAGGKNQVENDNVE